MISTPLDWNALEHWFEDVQNVIAEPGELFTSLSVTRDID
jgi:hypothetical protein